MGHEAPGAQREFKVFLGRCQTYDVQEIQGVIARGLDELGVVVAGENIVIKPNLVFAHPVHGRNGYTRPEVVEGLVRCLRQRSAGMRITLVEKCGVGVPTRVMFRRAGYYGLSRRLGVKLQPVEEDYLAPVTLEKGKVHRSLRLSRTMVHSDYLVFMPKLKTNVLSGGVTAALKLNMGSITDRERMQGHHHQLDAKIVDILEAACPRLIVTDAVQIAAGGNQMTQGGYHLGVIIMATDPVAHDLVAATILGLDPGKVGHLQEALSRGYGPPGIDAVELTGDVTLEEAGTVVRELIQAEPILVHDFPSPMRITSGQPYCAGGCHGVFLDWLYMIKDRQPHKIDRFPPLQVVIGEPGKVVEGNVLAVGRCACESGKLRGRVSRIKGCPPTHRGIILHMWLRHWILGPFVRAELVADAYLVYPLIQFKTWLKRLFTGGGRRNVLGKGRQGKYGTDGRTGHPAG